MRLLACALILFAGGAGAGEPRLCTDLTNPIRAMSACTAEIQRNANAAWAFNNRGLARRAAGDPLGALADFDKAIALRPDFAAAYNNRGTLHADLGDLLPALADHERALALEPGYVAAMHNRAVDLEELGRLTQALEAYQAVRRADPAHGPSRIGIATVTCKLGRIKASGDARLAAIQGGALEAAAMQRILRDEGFYRGPIDGIFGKGSRAALRAWTRQGCLPRA